MKLNTYTRAAIVRAIMSDVPKPDKTKRHAAVQAAIVKAMSPECRKVYNKTPRALATQYLGDTTYDGCNWHTREVFVGDVPKEQLNEIVKPYEDEDGAHYEAYTQLESAIKGCSTLNALKKANADAVNTPSGNDRALLQIADRIEALAEKVEQIP